jgi:hypothetical protein
MMGTNIMHAACLKSEQMVIVMRSFMSVSHTLSGSVLRHAERAAAASAICSA